MERLGKVVTGAGRAKRVRSSGSLASPGIQQTASRAREIEPFTQGDLDGLCGVYAIVNALRLLCPELDNRRSQLLFAKLVMKLMKIYCPPGEFLYRGVENNELWTLLGVARRYVKREFGVTLTTTPLTLRQERRRFDELWRTMRETLDGGGVTILAVSGHYGHWTVAYAASAKSVSLYDSDGLRSFRRAACSFGERTRHAIGPEDVIFLSRRGDRNKGGRRRRAIV